jgi:hypothetical protein
VLAAARKCRYCGYRFDAPRPGAARSLLERLGASRPQHEARFDEVLADWNISIAEGETTASFRYVSVDSQWGYLLVTDRRIVFIADRRREQTPVLEYSGHEVESVRAGRGRRHLIVQAAGSQHVIEVGAGVVAKELTAALAELVRYDVG